MTSMADSAERVVHIVDDDESVRSSIHWLLASAGIAARIYESPTAFLTLTDARPTGCVLLDMRMPGLDGLAVLKRLAQHGPTAPVVILTGHGDSADAAQAMLNGASAFIEKPFAADRLLAVIDDLLSPTLENAPQSA